MNVIFLGPPGAGKGTQASAVAAALTIPHISTGDMLRDAIRGGTPTGIKAKVYMDAGNLVPDDVVIDVVRERISLTDCANGYLLDGFPRTLDQARALDQIAAIDAVVDIYVPDEKLIRRLSGRRVCAGCMGTFHLDALNGSDICPVCAKPLIQRDDDNPDAIANRLDVYHIKTKPLTDYYADKAILKTVDGNRDVKAVTQSILEILAEDS